MSISLKFGASVSDDGTTLTVTDCTGTYSALNQGGWEFPNVGTVTALTAVIKIAKRNADGSLGDETSVDVFDTLPSNIGGDIDISATDAGQGGTFPDGVYRLVYTVTGSDAGTPYFYSVTQYKSFHPAINCCYQQLAVKSANCSCNCNEINDKFKSMTLQLSLLCRADGKGDLEAIQQYIDFITKMCNNCGCN